MKLFKLFVAVWFALLGLCAMPVAARDSATTGYDSTANPDDAVAQALKQARATSRKVLVIGGGDWCRWCMALEAFLARDVEAKAALDRAFVTVEVYYGDKNRNEKFFAKLPRAKGYPHFWIMGTDGKVANSVDTSIIEDGKSGYDKEKFLRFVRDYGA
jgi:thioredoxin-related protein